MAINHFRARKRSSLARIKWSHSLRAPPVCGFAVWQLPGFFRRDTCRSAPNRRLANAPVPGFQSTAARGAGRRRIQLRAGFAALNADGRALGDTLTRPAFRAIALFGFLR